MECRNVCAGVWESGFGQGARAAGRCGSAALAQPFVAQPCPKLRRRLARATGSQPQSDPAAGPQTAAARPRAHAAWCGNWSPAICVSAQTGWERSPRVMSQLSPRKAARTRLCHHRDPQGKALTTRVPRRPAKTAAWWLQWRDGNALTVVRVRRPCPHPQTPACTLQRPVPRPAQDDLFG